MSKSLLTLLCGILCAEPRKPGPPTNLTEGDTLIMGDKVAVTLHWFPPSHSDLPVSRYKATIAIFCQLSFRIVISHCCKSCSSSQGRNCRSISLQWWSRTFNRSLFRCDRNIAALQEQIIWPNVHVQIQRWEYPPWRLGSCWFLWGKAKLKLSHWFFAIYQQTYK